MIKIERKGNLPVAVNGKKGKECEGFKSLVKQTRVSYEPEKNAHIIETACFSTKLQVFPSLVF